MEKSQFVRQPPSPSTIPNFQFDDKARIRKYRNILLVAGVLIAVSYVLAVFFLFIKPPASITEGPISLDKSRQLPDADLWLETYVVKNAEQTALTAVNPDISYNVELEIDPDSTDLTNVYLIDPATHQRQFYTKLKKVYRDHVHPAEFNHGNLYILHRIENADQVDPQLQLEDQLWKYRADGKGRNIFTGLGADFRVAPDNEHVVVTAMNNNRELGKVLTFLSGEGIVDQTYSAKELQMENVVLEKWTNNTFWVSELAGPIPQKLISVTLPDYDLSDYSLSNLSIGREYEIHPNAPKIAYSDYPVLLDADSQVEFDQQPKTITLKVTDLVKNSTQVVATSTNKPFLPKWKNQLILEFNNPAGEGRVSQSIAQ